MLRVDFQGSTTIRLSKHIVLFVLEIQCSEGSVRVDDDEDLPEVGLSGDLS